jgi:ABC-2 type transport system permease protein
MPLLRHTLRSLRVQIVAYGVGIGLYAALMVLLYPVFKDTLAELEIPEGYAAFFGQEATDFSDPRTFLTAELMSLLPLITAIYAVVASTGLLASDEQRGTLELLLSQPLSRARLFVERVGALVIGALLISLLGAIGFAIPALFVDLGGVSPLVLAGAMFNLVPLMLACAGLGLLVAAVAPSRGVASGIVAAETAVVFLMNSVANLADVLEPLHYLSPFYYADSNVVLTNGPSPWHIAVLLGAFVGLTALAQRAFARREIGGTRWQPRALLGGDGSAE